MQKKTIKPEGRYLQAAINTLLLNASFIDNLGLMHGKTGISVFFFHLSRSTENKVYEEYAGELIDEIYEEITINTPVDFENGLAGIGWGIEYLVQNGFIEANTDEVLEDFDDKIYKELIQNTPEGTCLLTGILGIGAYFLKRLQNPLSTEKNNTTSGKKQTLGHILDMLDKRTQKIDELIKEPILRHPSKEQIHKSQTANDNVFDITWEYPLILWFLAELYEQNIFSFKVEKMIGRFIGQLSQENHLPKLQSNRLLLALSLTRLGKITDAHQITHGHSDNQTLKQSDIELIINNLLEKINRDTLESELPPDDATIKDSSSGIAWIYMQLHRLAGGNHFRNEMEYWHNKLFLLGDKDSFLTGHCDGGDNIFGILKGLAGIMLLAKPITQEAHKQ